MDADVVAGFQFTGQDIPWLLEKWAVVQPDTPLLIWEPKEGGGARWTYGEFQTATRRLAAGLAAKGYITKGGQSRSSTTTTAPRWCCRPSPQGTPSCRGNRRSGSDHKYAQRRCRDELLRPAD